MKKQYKLPTILGLIVLVLGVVAGIFLVQNTQVFRLAADPSETPKNVRITNIKDNSFTVSWITDKETVGFVAYGGSTSLGQTTSKNEGKAVSLHHETVTGLSPQTTYFFKIAAGGRLFDNNGSTYQIKTAPSLPSAKEQDLIFGVVKNQTGQGEGAIVYVTFGGTSPLSATTDKTGQWLINLADARSSDLAQYAQYDKKSTVLEIFVQGESDQFATAKVRVGSGKPVPDITLGKTYDFTQQEPAQPGEVPRSTLELPQQTQQKPAFPTEPLSATDKKEVVLTKPKDNEKVTGGRPEFSGTGTPGTTITIKVESPDPIVDTITIGSSGTWTWTPPKDLTSETHTVTVSWTDETGKTKTIKRSFTVAAASPLGGVLQTPTPSSTPSARVAIPSTESGVPVAGDLTGTITLFIMGLLLFFTGLFLPKFLKS